MFRTNLSSERVFFGQVGRKVVSLSIGQSVLSSGGVALDEQARQTRTRYLLIILILITIPCYILGFVLLRINRSPKVPSPTPVSTQGPPLQDTNTPTITLTGYLTRTATVTPTETLIPSETLTPTSTITQTPSPSPSPSETATETATELPDPTDEPIDTPEPTVEPDEPNPTEP